MSLDQDRTELFIKFQSQYLLLMDAVRDVPFDPFIRSIIMQYFYVGMLTAKESIFALDEKTIAAIKNPEPVTDEKSKKKKK